MAKKKYFWLRLKVDFFGQKEIKKLRKIAGGDTYVIIYLKLQLLSINTNGKLFFEGYEDSFVKELALEIDEEEDNVQVTFSFLERYGLIEIISEDELLLPEAVKAIGSETDSAERVRKCRERKKALQCNTDVTNGNAIETKSNTDIDIEIEKDIDIETETDKNIEFTAFWSAYPKQTDKESTYFEWLKTISKGISKEDLVQSVINYANEVIDYAPRFIKSPKNYLADKKYLEYLPNTYKAQQNKIIPLVTKNKFNDFPQRQYTKEQYADMESKLLNKSFN